MFKFIKKLLKRRKRKLNIVYKNGKAYKFRSFEKSVAFMLS